MKWPSEPTHLEFLVHRDRLVIRQDGKLLAQTRVTIRTFDRLKKKNLRMDWGTGPFGKFEGGLVPK